MSQTADGARAVLVWLREDLRVDDQRALQAAAAAADACGLPVHAVWCAVPAQWTAHGMGDNRRWFVLESARELLDTLAAAGILLHVRDAGNFTDSIETVLALAGEIGARSIHFNREYPLNEVRRDAAFASAAALASVRVQRHDDGMLVPPGRVLTKAGTPYAVFTPYRQAWYQSLAQDPDAMPREFCAPATAVPADVLHPIRGASLSAFADEAVRHYDTQRDLPAVPGTSTLSPYLAAGCLSPRRALAAARAANRGDIAECNRSVVTWISELAWRDFYRQVMYHNPRVAMGRAFRRDTDHIVWRRDPADFAAWCEGRTGYPLVDAAMRQLVTTGWMHNRLRMVAANNGGWQWSASTGTDAAPYFRLFSPVRQGERFDAEGEFVRHWLPALRDVSAKHIHAPQRAGLFAAPDYPLPIIDHAQAKARVLSAFSAAATESRRKQHG